jgi:hypothetical protein
MPKMLAIKKEFHYGRKTVKAGELFDVLDKDVKLLRALRHARDPDPEVPKTQKAPEPRALEPKAAEPVVTQALQPEPHDGHENPTEIKVRRTYRRRDMTSEE